MIDAIDDGGPFSDTAGQHQARRRAQIGRHHLRARKLLHAVTDSGIALDLRVRAHTDQLRNVHEAVFKDRFGDHAGPFRYQVKPVSYTHLDVYKRQLFFRLHDRVFDDEGHHVPA